MRLGPRRISALAAGFVLFLAAGCGAARAPGEPRASPGRHLGGPASAPRSHSCGTAGPPAGPPAPHPAALLSGVQFVSPSDGWAVASDRILHTSDGGRHWVIQLRTRPNAQLGAVDFVDATHGWAVGATELLATTDGGTRWHALPEPCLPIRAVDFFSPSDGVAVAGGKLSYWGVLDPPLGAGALLATTDGGARWHRLPAPPHVESACFSYARRGWIGAGGGIYGTADGGRTWTL